MREPLMIWSLVSCFSFLRAAARYITPEANNVVPPMMQGNEKTVGIDKLFSPLIVSFFFFFFF